MRKKISFLILTILAVGSLYFIAFPEGDKAFATIQSNSVIKIDKNTTNGPTTIGEEDYGQSVENIGDLDGDGIDDIAVGVILDDNGDILTENYGAIFIHFMNTNGTIDSSVKIDSTTPNGPSLDYNDYRYGSSIESIGDLNGDGVPDIAVGAVSYFGNASNTGAVFIHFMNTDGSIDSTVTLDRSTVNGALTTTNPGGGGDYYGHGIANLGDLNGDGVIDLAVGSPLESQNGSDRCAVFIHFMNTYGSVDSKLKIN